MPTKQGNGGHGQENYDPATGRYVGNETSNNLEKYHAGSGFPSAELEKQLLNGDFGQDFVDYYNKGIRCKKCTDSINSEKLISGTVSAFDYIFSNTGKKMFSFRVSDEVLMQMERICNIMIREYLVFAQNSYDFLKTLI